MYWIYKRVATLVGNPDDLTKLFVNWTDASGNLTSWYSLGFNDDDPEALYQKLLGETYSMALIQ